MKLFKITFFLIVLVSSQLSIAAEESGLQSCTDFFNYINSGYNNEVNKLNEIDKELNDRTKILKNLDRRQNVLACSLVRINHSNQATFASYQAIKKKLVSMRTAGNQCGYISQGILKRSNDPEVTKMFKGGLEAVKTGLKVMDKLSQLHASYKKSIDLMGRSTRAVASAHNINLNVSHSCGH